MVNLLHTLLCRNKEISSIVQHIITLLQQHFSESIGHKVQYSGGHIMYYAVKILTLTKEALI